jgi:hypothetical protein
MAPRKLRRFPGAPGADRTIGSAQLPVEGRAAWGTRSVSDSAAYPDHAADHFPSGLPLVAEQLATLHLLDAG